MQSDDEDSNYIDRMYGARRPSPTQKARSPEAIAKAESRIGKRQIGAWLDEEYHRGMRMVAARRALTMQAVLEEAIADFLEKYGHPLPPRR